MSLHALANNMAAQGRGPDSTLVHMSPREVDGLQALAMRHGGSLTINPQTGLPEAGFLSSILPLVAGIGLTAMGMPAGLTALTVGGSAALATGDLKKGLMAGLGAYGGAGLAESLIGSGAAGLAPEAVATAANAVPVETAAEIASANQAGLTMPSVVEPAISASLPPVNAADPFRLGSSVAPQPFDKLPTQTPNYTPPITTTPSPYSNVSNATAGGPMSGPSIAESTYPVQLTPENMTMGQRFDALKAGTTGQNLLDYAKNNKLATAGMLAGPLTEASENNVPSTPVGDSDRGAMANAGYEYDPGWANPTPAPNPFGREQTYNRPRYYIPKKAKGADGGAVQYFDDGGAIGGAGQGTPALNKFSELQAARAASPPPVPIDVKQQFADYLKAQATPVTVPVYAPPVIEPRPPEPEPMPVTMPEDLLQQRGGGGRGYGGGFGGDGGDGGGGYGGPAGGGYAAKGGYLTNGQFDQNYADGGVTGMADGGMYNLGSYSDGGRLLRGPGDGVSDSIPAVIGRKQPARLADGEFVIPARIVSEIGNGSTEAGARKLYAMMDRVQKSRRKTVGKGKVAKNTRADRYLPA